MILIAGEFTFTEYQVCFHMDRSSIYVPWRVIGIYFTSSRLALCRYTTDFYHIEKAYRAEVKEAGQAANSREFLERWAKLHSEVNSVMSPVIRYYTTTRRADHAIKDFAECALGRNDSITISRLIKMAQSHERYFSVVFMQDWPYRTKVLDALRKERMI